MFSDRRPIGLADRPDIKCEGIEKSMAQKGVLPFTKWGQLGQNRTEVSFSYCDPNIDLTP